MRIVGLILQDGRGFVEVSLFLPFISISIFTSISIFVFVFILLAKSLAFFARFIWRCWSQLRLLI